MAIFLAGSNTPICGGKRGSAVFQNTANGRVMRANVKARQNKTSKWQKSKANLLAAVSNWRQLNATEQSEWDTLALTLPKTDACGNTYYLSGQQLFTQGGKNRADSGLALPTTAPNSVSLPGLTINSIEIDISDQTFIADINPLNIPVSNLWYYYATPPLSAGVSNPSAAAFIYLENAGEGDESDINLWNSYNDLVAPISGNVGQAIFLKIVEIDVDSGISIPPVVAKGVITA